MDPETLQKLNVLSQGLGITPNQLWSYFIHHALIQGVEQLFQGAILFIVFYWNLKYLFRWVGVLKLNRSDDRQGLAIAATVFNLVCGGFTLTYAVIFLRMGFLQVTAPQVAAITNLLQALTGAPQ
jgi:hypothetical protein